MSNSKKIALNPVTYLKQKTEIVKKNVKHISIHSSRAQKIKSTRDHRFIPKKHVALGLFLLSLWGTIGCLKSNIVDASSTQESHVLLPFKDFTKMDWDSIELPVSIDREFTDPITFETFKPANSLDPRPVIWLQALGGETSDASSEFIWVENLNTRYRPVLARPIMDFWLKNRYLNIFTNQGTVGTILLSRGSTRAFPITVGELKIGKKLRDNPSPIYRFEPGANLDGALLSDKGLYEADLQGATLKDALLQRTKLVRANLMGANLKGAKLWHTDLQGANLENADFEGAELIGANLQNAKLKGAKFRSAKISANTKMPWNWRCQVASRP